jgi:DNA-binding GntR family transcriptional regulator
MSMGGLTTAMPLRTTVDPQSATPVYVQVADILRARIEAGDLQPDRPVPSEAQLQQEFGIARGTARKGIALLRDQGLVVTVRGRGSFVKPGR